MVKYIVIKTFQNSGTVDTVDLFDTEDDVRSHFESELDGYDIESDEPVDSIMEDYEISDNDQFTWTIVRKEI